MIAVYLFYGLAFFTLGLAALLESRRSSALLLGRQLPWLAAFGLTHSLVEWSELLLMTDEGVVAHDWLHTAHFILLPLSALFLIRFGVGLIGEGGPLPRWLLLSPMVLIVPLVLVAAYGLVIVLTGEETAADVWSRWLLLFPGALLAGAGFLRQSWDTSVVVSPRLRGFMRGAGFTFFYYAVVAGLVVPEGPYGVAPWLNDEMIRDVTGLPIQLWRMFSAISLTFLVVRALDIFDYERKQHLDTATRKQKEAEATLRESEVRFRNVFEYAPIGMDIVAADGTPLETNRAWQQMLGYSAAEMRQMRFVDYTYPDDVDVSTRLTREVYEGKRDSFQLEKRYIRKDGAVIDGKVTVSAVRGPQGEFRHFIAMVEDITEQKQTALALRQERERAQETQLQMEAEARAVAERWVNTLVEIGGLIAHMESADVVLTHIMNQAQQLLPADAVTLGLLDETGTRLQLKYHASANGARSLDDGLFLDNPQLLALLRARRACRLPDGDGAGQISWYCPTLARVVETAAVVPLQFDGQVVGGLWAARFRPEPFTPNQLFGLRNLADQAVIALQHAAMASRLQSVATLEERSRIAREMHDGLAQILGYVGVQMQTIEAYMQQGQAEKVLDEVHKTRHNVRQAQADVRDNILSLRTTLAGEAGLIPALEEYVVEFSLQCDCSIEARLVNHLQGAPHLSPVAEVQLVRIVQEALTNVRKHARAEHVTVCLEPSRNGVRVTVADDGVGFRRSRRQRRFGLQTMAERASSAGGTLSVHSEPGAGTTVCLWLPLVRT